MINLTIVVDSGNTNYQQQMSVTTLCTFGTQARIVPGYPYHITQRGNLRQETFSVGMTTGRPFVSPLLIDTLEVLLKKQLRKKMAEPKDP